MNEGKIVAVGHVNLNLALPHISLLPFEKQ